MQKKQKQLISTSKKSLSQERMVRVMSIYQNLPGVMSFGLKSLEMGSWYKGHRRGEPLELLTILVCSYLQCRTVLYPADAKRVFMDIPITVYSLYQRGNSDRISSLGVIIFRVSDFCFSKFHARNSSSTTLLKIAAYFTSYAFIYHRKNTELFNRAGVFIFSQSSTKQKTDDDKAQHQREMEQLKAQQSVALQQQESRERTALEEKQRKIDELEEKVMQLERDIAKLKARS